MNNAISPTVNENIYRVTGPPENFITAMSIGYWALNEKNIAIWDNLHSGDILLFHSTRKSGYSNTVPSAIVGYARVGSTKFKKSERWWVQEIDNDEIIWPYAFSLDHICLLQDLSEKIDLTKGIHQKSTTTVRAEVEALSKAGIPISELNEKSGSLNLNSDMPQFPVNGSMSKLNDIYPELIFSDFAEEWFQCHGDGPDLLLEERQIGETEEQRLSRLSKDELIEIARKWSGIGPSHTRGWRKTRREDARQKKIVAKIEDNRCQVCDFFCEYQNSRGRSRYIIHVDHIDEKAAGGDESLKNLWVLCPNCHAKKTAGLLKVDVRQNQVTLAGQIVQIRDHHLFVD